MNGPPYLSKSHDEANYPYEMQDVDDVRFAEPETGTRLPVKKETKRKHRGPLRVPVALTAAAGISLLLTAAKRPFGTLTVDIARDGELGEVTFLPEQD